MMAVKDRMLLVLVLLQIVIHWSNATITNDDIITMIDQETGTVSGETNDTIARDLKDIKRRLRGHHLVADYYNYLSENDETDSYFDDEYEYFTDEILSEWVDSLAYDEAMYVYNLLNEDESGSSAPKIKKKAVIKKLVLPYFQLIGTNKIKKKSVIKFSKYCKLDKKSWLKRGKHEFKKGKKITICKPAPSVMSKATNSGYTPRFSPDKIYTIKGLAYRKKGSCKKGPVSPSKYYIQFTDQTGLRTETTHLISLKNFQKLISGSGKMRFNGKVIETKSTDSVRRALLRKPPKIKTLKKKTNKRCVALSGGGIRSAMGSFLFLNELEKKNKLNKVECISAISGGSWGLIMWLFKNSDDIEQSIKTNQYPWGPTIHPKGTVNGKLRFTLYEKWSQQIEQHIFRITSLKGQIHILLEEVQKQLEHLNLGKSF